MQAAFLSQSKPSISWHHFHIYKEMSIEKKGQTKQSAASLVFSASV
jgi:hypothetical protein